MAEKWQVVKRPFEREIVRTVEYGVYAKNGKELVGNVTSRKDANLIAASPLMLEALMQVVAIYDNSVGFSASAFRAVMPTVKAAIAAAKGE